MEIQKFNKNQKFGILCSRSLQDVLQLPSISHDDFEQNTEIRFRTESLDSKESPKIMMSNEHNINISESLLNPKNEKNRQIGRKIQLMRNLEPIERPKTAKNLSGSIHNNSKSLESESKINNSETNQLNIEKNVFEKVLVKKYCDANEVSLKLEELSNKVDIFELKLFEEKRIAQETQSKLGIIEQNLKSTENLFKEQLDKIEQSMSLKYQKIKEYFSCFGDHFKSHLKLYDKKRKEIENRLEAFDQFMKYLPEIFDSKIKGAVNMTKISFDNEIKRIKEELNIQSIVNNELKGLLDLQAMSQNDSKMEFDIFSNHLKEIRNQIDLQSIFQKELENEMKIMNQTQGDLFKGMRKNDNDLDTVKKTLQNVSTNYHFLKKLQEKDTVIKTQFIDLLQDFNFLKNKLFKNDENFEKNSKQEAIEEIGNGIIKFGDEKKNNEEK